MLCGSPPFYSKDREQLYRNIKSCSPKLDFPFLSEDARDLCRRLLEKDPAKRLGSTEGGIRAISDHPWFDSIDWDDIQYKRMTPPYKPQLAHSTDTKHFPKEFTAMKMSPQDVESLQDHSSAAAGWQGFSFENKRTEDPMNFGGLGGSFTFNTDEPF